MYVTLLYSSTGSEMYNSKGGTYGALQSPARLDAKCTIARVELPEMYNSMVAALLQTNFAHSHRMVQVGREVLILNEVLPDFPTLASESRIGIPAPTTKR